MKNLKLSVNYSTWPDLAADTTPLMLLREILWLFHSETTGPFPKEVILVLERVKADVLPMIGKLCLMDPRTWVNRDSESATFGITENHGESEGGSPSLPWVLFVLNVRRLKGGLKSEDFVKCWGSSTPFPCRQASRGAARAFLRGAV